MNSKKILGCLGAATLAVGISAGPVVAAGAAPSSQAVSSAKVSTAKHASPARKKKKIKVVFAASPNPAGCYNLAVQVLRKGAPVPGAIVRFQALHNGRWYNTPDPKFAMDANGAFATDPAKGGGGLHKPNGAPSRDKVRIKYKHNYSKGIRVPCGR